MSYLALRAQIEMRVISDKIKRRVWDAGLTTTEVAILTFILVALATAVGAVLWDKSNTSVSKLDLEPDFSDG